MVEGLRVAAGTATVLHDLSFDAPRGSITGLLGPSGCGKTTLMRAVVGVQIVEAGTVTVLGQPAGSAQLRDKIGYATQNPSVYADLTVTEALRYFARSCAHPASDVARVIDEVGLGTHADHIVGELSGGQLNRASLAVALLGRAGAAGARRAHGRTRPGAARGAVDAVPPARRPRRDAAGVQPRDGRGRPLRAAAADARRPHPRRRHPGRAAHDDRRPHDLEQAFLQLVREQEALA